MPWKLRFKSFKLSLKKWLTKTKNWASNLKIRRKKVLAKIPTSKRRARVWRLKLKVRRQRRIKKLWNQRQLKEARRFRRSRRCKRSDGSSGFHSNFNCFVELSGKSAKVDQVYNDRFIANIIVSLVRLLTIEDLQAPTAKMNSKVKARR